MNTKKKWYFKQITIVYTKEMIIIGMNKQNIYSNDKTGGKLNNGRLITLDWFICWNGKQKQFRTSEVLV